MIKKMDKKAFTLIELIVVIAVVGILVLLGVPRFIGHTQKAELTRIQYDIKVMEQEIGTEFINNDDDFNNWENNNKDFNQLIQEGKLFEKEGPVNNVEDLSADNAYKVIPEKYKDKINTKLKGTFYANSGGKVYYEHIKPLGEIPTKPEKTPEHSDEEIQDLINKGYIPIATANELNNVRNTTLETYGKGTKWEGQYTGGLLDKKYIQVANINLSGYSEEGWNPIGSYTDSTNKSPFIGSFDGNGYNITGLTINNSTDYVGLFGYTEKATISNIALEGINVTGSGEQHVGGLVGSAYKSSINSSYTTGSVTGTEGYVGGLVGLSTYSTISNSYSTGKVKGSSDSVGGLLGFANNETKINNSYATGSVKGSNWVGGLVGFAGTDTAINTSYATGSVTGSGNQVGGLVGRAYINTIKNSYATGSVDSTGNYVGGLVGWSSFGTISNSYATGKLTGSSRVGGLVGYADYITISNSYWDKDTTDQPTSSGEEVGKSEGKSTKEMKLKDTYSGWDFGTVWEIDEGKDYPKLR